jgi:predicted esterase
MNKECITGKASFQMDVSYKIIETGDESEKPLILYLHGYKQNRHYFEKRCADLLSIEAYHLFLQGPYPVYDETRARKLEEWGRAWYLYDGEQEQFLQSLEKSSQFIEELINEIRTTFSINRSAVIGYSMGGYLAGYFALSRPQCVDDLIVMGGRIKSEIFSEKNYNGLRALHIHGSKDESVAAEEAKKSCTSLGTMGAEVSFQEIDAGHKLNSAYMEEVKAWLETNGYESKRNKK